MYRMIGAAALTVLLAFTASACSSASSALPPLEAVQSAAAQVEEEKTFAFELEVTMDPEEEANSDSESDSSGFGALFGGNMTMTAEGQFDLENDRAQFAANLVIIEMESIMDGDICYVRSNWTGEKWVKEDPCEDAVVMESGGDSPIGDPFSDPAGFVSSLEEHAESVEDMGEAEVRGETARHLRLEMAGPEFEEYLEGDSLPIDLYLDDEGRIVRLETEFTTEDESMAGMGADEEASMVTMTMRMDFFDYGEPVELEIPSEDEIADEDEMFGGGFEFDSEDMDGTSGLDDLESE